MASQRGKYIVLEGDEGAGKTEQLRRLHRRLEVVGLTVKVVREPGGDPFAEQMREILKHAEYVVTPQAEALAFSAARANLLANVVEPLLAQGTWVLADRSALSTMVYQGYGHGIDSPAFRGAVAYGASVAKPDQTIIIDIPLAVSVQRLVGRGEALDRFERLGREFRERINSGYRNYAEHAEYETVDGVGTRDEVEQRIWNLVAPTIGEQHA